MSERPKLLLLMALLGVLGMFSIFRGCGAYGEVGPKAYEHAKALYSICNHQDADRLQAFSTSLQAAYDAGEVTQREQEWLEDIVTKAQAGDWEEAAAEARRLMQAQVKDGP